MRILLVGDVHGRWRDLNNHIALVHSMFRINGAIQVGDFGLFEENFRLAKEHDLYFHVPLHVLDGNHEDHAWLSWAFEMGLVAKWPASMNLFYHSRASVFNLYGTKIGVLGGALHVDRPQQIAAGGQITNFVQPIEVKAALRLFNEVRPEIIATHTCPAGIGLGIPSDRKFTQGIIEHILSAGYTPAPFDDCGDMELRNLWQNLQYRPKLWIFGHFHRSYDIQLDGTHFVCLPGLTSPIADTLALWDTEEKSLYQLRWNG